MKPACRAVPFVVLALLLAVAPAAAGPADTIEAECLAQLNMPPAACRCIGERAVSELNANQVEMFIAMVTKDDATSARLRSQMPVNELTQTAMFMTSAPQRCMGG
jgi:hypothetical protein